MSADEEAVNRRETAFRLFATEFEDSNVSYTESDEERAPNYVITPTGARVNRLFVVGVLTEVQQVSDDVLRARVVDPTGAFVVYAGQYQPDEQAFLERTDPPAFVAVAGKARTFQPEDSDVVYTSIRPESINEVDAETRDRWTVRTAERTLDRIETIAAALESNDSEELQERLTDRGVPDGLAAGIPLAIEHYGTSSQYLNALRETALDALRVVTGEREEVTERSVAPDASGEVDLSSLASIDLSTSEPSESTPEPDTSTPDSRAGTATGSEPTGEADAKPAGEAEPAEPESRAETDGETEPGAEEPAEPDTSTATESTDDETPSEATTAPAGEAVTTDDAATEPGTGVDAESETSDTGSDELGDFDPEEFDLDEETRKEVQSEYGTEFQSGTEVDEPGEAGIETPEAEEPAAASDAAGSESTAETAASESETVDSTNAAESEPSTDESVSADESEAVDLEDAVMDAMTELDDGDGANREQVIAAVVDEQGADPGAVEDAVQDALMDGRCYEPDDETLKPI